jgi:hypothetical protein
MFDILGWIGAILILLAYFKASIGHWPANKPLNAILNLTGASFLALNAWNRGAYPNLGLEIVFCMIAINVIYTDIKND